MNDIQRHVAKRKPRKCPVCGSPKVVPILYGRRPIDEDVRAGRIALGGCVITDDSPAWKCLDCDVPIYSSV